MAPSPSPSWDGPIAVPTAVLTAVPTWPTPVDLTWPELAGAGPNEHCGRTNMVHGNRDRTWTNEKMDKVRLRNSRPTDELSMIAGILKGLGTSGVDPRCRVQRSFALATT